MSLLFAPITITIGRHCEWIEFQSLMPKRGIDPFIALLFEDKKRIDGVFKVAKLLRRLRSNSTSLNCIHGLCIFNPNHSETTIEVSLHNADGLAHLYEAFCGEGFKHKIKVFLKKHLEIDTALAKQMMPFYNKLDVNGHLWSDEIQMIGAHLPPILRQFLDLYAIENVAIELENVKINPRGRIPSKYSQVFNENTNNLVGYRENTNSTNHGGSGGGGAPKNNRVAEINRQVRELKRTGKMMR